MSLRQYRAPSEGEVAIEFRKLRGDRVDMDVWIEGACNATFWLGLAGVKGGDEEARPHIMRCEKQCLWLVME
jgi:hypothetical protein